MSTLPAPRYLNRATPPHLTTLVLIAGAGVIPMNIFLASLPEMARFYDQPYSVMHLSLTGYLALTSLVQLFLGPLSDRLGRRPVLLWGLVLFIGSAIGAALTTTFEWFMLFRCIQTSVVVGLVLSRAAVRDMVAREQAASMLGYIAMGMALAPMLAPALGGMLADQFGWQSNFYALSLIGSLALAIAYLDQGETNLHRSASFMEQFQSYPELITSRRFWGYTFTLVFAVGTFFAFIGGAPFVGERIYNLSASEVGWCLAITPLGYMIGNFISARFANRIGIYKMIVSGCLLTFFGMAPTLLVAWLDVQHPLAFFAFTAAIGLGNGLVLPSANAGMLDVRPQIAGSASGLSGALMTLGGAALAALSSLLLTEETGIYPLILCVLVSSFASLLAALYTIRVEQQVRRTG